MTDDGDMPGEVFKFNRQLKDYFMPDARSRLLRLSNSNMT